MHFALWETPERYFYSRKNISFSHVVANFIPFLLVFLVLQSSQQIGRLLPIQCYTNLQSQQMLVE
jgi:hypothetical protein